jgi:hypothetical protein
MKHEPRRRKKLAVSAKTKAKPRRRDAKVILHVYVDPPVRQGLHMIARFEDGEANDVLREMVREGLERRGFPVPESLAATT